MHILDTYMCISIQTICTNTQEYLQLLYFYTTNTASAKQPSGQNVYRKRKLTRYQNKQVCLSTQQITLKCHYSTNIGGQQALRESI